MNDLKFAFRQLLKNPGFTAVAALTLALSMGANTTIFSPINAALLRELPFPNSDRLAVVWADNPGLKLSMSQVPPANADVAAWREQSKSFTRVAAFSPRTADLADGGDTERVGAAGVTPGFFQTLGVAPLLGRTLTSEEEEPNRPPAVLGQHDEGKSDLHHDQAPLQPTRAQVEHPTRPSLEQFAGIAPGRDSEEDERTRTRSQARFKVPVHAHSRNVRVGD